MLHNASHKFESAYLGVAIPKNNTVLLNSLEGSNLGIWLHMRRKILITYAEDQYNIVAKYSYSNYPANPNGSDYDVAALATRWSSFSYDATLRKSYIPMAKCFLSENHLNDEVTPGLKPLQMLSYGLKKTKSRINNLYFK